MEILIGCYILINIAGIIVMRMDKQRAIEQRWRISESNLWGIAIFGGALGAWIGMKTFRHKTKRPSFKYGLPLLTMLHIIVGIYFLLTTNIMNI